MRACMCARRLTRPSSMTMPSTSARASGLLLWSFRRRLALLPLADISTGSATLQRSSFAVLGACGGHPKTRRCARPARWSTGRLRRIAELLTRGSAIVGRRCDQPPSGAPRRAGRAAGAGPGAPRLLAGHATAGAALPGTPGAWTCLPGAGPTRTRNAAAVRARAPRLSRRIPIRRWWRTAGGTPGRESSGVRVGGRARFRSLPAVGRSSGALLGTFATACCSAPGQLFMRAGTASAAVAGPTPSAVPVIETGIDPRLVITS